MQSSRAYRSAIRKQDGVYPPVQGLSGFLSRALLPPLLRVDKHRISAFHCSTKSVRLSVCVPGFAGRGPVSKGQACHTFGSVGGYRIYAKSLKYLKLEIRLTKILFPQFLKPRFEGIVSHLALPEEEARRALLQTPELLLIEDLGALRDQLRAELAQRGLVPEVEVIESTSEESGVSAIEEKAIDAESSSWDEDASAESRGNVSLSERSDDGLREDDVVTLSGLVEGGLTEIDSVSGVEIGEMSRSEEGEEASPSGQTGVQVDINRIIALFGHRLHEAGVKEFLDRTLGLLGAELGMSPAELRTVLAEYPAVLELEPREIAGKIQALRGEGLSTDEIRGMVVADPDWLGVDLEGAFTPKLEFLKVDMARSVNELLEFPNFLCYR